MLAGDVRRILLGTFVRPPEETGGDPRVEAVFGYVVRHDRATVLLDTGLGEADTETEAWYRPRRIPLPAALAGLSLTLDDIGVVVNCHLHFDHCGGNPLLAGRPVVVQRTELAAARAGDYTFEHLVDHRGVRYDELDGVVECADGSVVLAGQSHDTASAWSADALAATAAGFGHTAPLPVPPAWMARLLAFDPRRVYFAHDAAVW